MSNTFPVQSLAEKLRDSSLSGTDSKMEDEENRNSNVEENSTMSHQEALAFVEKGMLDIIRTDPLLQYLPPAVTLEELNSMLALEHGRAMTVIIHRADDQSYSVVVEQKATVMDLKKAIQRHVALKLKREGGERTLSWRYIWKTYWLYYDNKKLTDDSRPLKDYGVRDKCELTFIKRLRRS